MGIQHVEDLEFYRSQWLHVSDLKGKAVRVTVTGWEVVTVQAGPNGGKVAKIALSFRNATKRLLLNRANGQAAARVWGSLNHWNGRQCVLQPGTGVSKQQTIVLIPYADGADGADGDGAGE